MRKSATSDVEMYNNAKNKKFQRTGDKRSPRGGAPDCGGGASGDRYGSSRASEYLVSERHLQILDKNFSIMPNGKLIVIGVGKCALEAAHALESILGERITAGVVIDIHTGTLAKIQTMLRHASVSDGSEYRGDKLDHLSFEKSDRARFCAVRHFRRRFDIVVPAEKFYMR